MRRLSLRSGFTLIEMLMVMVIISIIAALVVGVAGYATRKASASRTRGEIQALNLACDKYKADNGTYPRKDKVTEGSAGLNPVADGVASSDKYRKASLLLYQHLSGDMHTAPSGGGGEFDEGTPTGIPDKNYTTYYEFKRSMLGGVPATATGPKGPTYLQDAYGLSFGYSTVGLRNEEDYRQRATSDPNASRGENQGFNTTVDIWSTAGSTSTLSGKVTDANDQKIRAKWLTNW